MKVKLISYMFILITVFTLSIQPFDVLADSKNPVRITDQTMVVFPIDETTVQVVQTITFINNGEHMEEQLPIYLPENHADLQLGNGIAEENIQETSKGISDITGLEAGEEKQIVVFYKMPMVNNLSRWAIEQSYVTEQIQVVIQPGVLSFSASNLITQSDLFEMNGQEFRRFTRLGVHPNKPWNLSFRLLNKSNQTEQIATTKANAKYTEDGKKIIGNDSFGYNKAIFTIVIIIVALVAALIGLKRDLLKTTGHHKKVKRSWLVDEKHLLLTEVVQLEKDFRSNLITESTYKKNREKIREQLIRITAELE